MIFNKDRATWPNWLWHAWERDWDQPGSLQPVPGTNYYLAINSRGQKRSLLPGEELSRRDLS